MFVRSDIYKNHDAAMKIIAKSGLNTIILGLLHVNCTDETWKKDGMKNPFDSSVSRNKSLSIAGCSDADIDFNDILLVSSGEYVKQENYPDLSRKNLHQGKVEKVFASFGGWEVPEFERIAALMEKYGIEEKAKKGGKNPLYANFKCLKKKLGIDGIDFDPEQGYKKGTIVEFAKMLLDIGFEITFCPFTKQDFWKNCVKELGEEKVSKLNVQCYAGGKTNASSKTLKGWTQLGVPVVAGLDLDELSPKKVKDQFETWIKAGIKLDGGFFWTDKPVKDDLGEYIRAMNTGLSN